MNTENSAQVNSVQENIMSDEIFENSVLHFQNEESVQTPMTPVQIQQEYFENLGDSDWVK